MVVHWQGEKDTSVKIYHVTSGTLLEYSTKVSQITAFQLILKFYYFKGFFEEMIDFQNSVQD